MMPERSICPSTGLHCEMRELLCEIPGQAAFSEAAVQIGHTTGSKILNFALNLLTWDSRKDFKAGLNASSEEASRLLETEVDCSDGCDVTNQIFSGYFNLITENATLKRQNRRNS